jgi:hypothetical protein
MQENRHRQAYGSHKCWRYRVATTDGYQSCCSHYYPANQRQTVHALWLSHIRSLHLLSRKMISYWSDMASDRHGLSESRESQNRWMLRQDPSRLYRWYCGDCARLWATGGRVLWFADAATLDQHVVLPCESDGSQWDHQEQIWHVRLCAFPSHDVTFIGSETAT